ncbi:MAG TPA: D-alanyl-D-alanine carboxypeptidase family protein [Candidatus Binataceae bacterium]
MEKPTVKILAAVMVAAFLAASTPPRASAAERPRRRAAAAAAPSPEVLAQIHVFGDRPAPFALDARAAMLIDARTGAVLYAYNEHQRMQPASLAKIMTFYLTLDAMAAKKIALDTEIPISEAAWRLSMNDTVSRMFLGVGQKVAVRDLLYGLMVSSGNDAAVALAEYLGGSSEAFTVQMNAKAQELGLTDTHFANPDGLPVEGEYTTAADMVKLARDLIQKHKEAITYTSAKDFTFDKINQRNFNTLLFYDHRVNGIKTGHVDEAGFHLVASAESNGMDLLSAVMGTPNAEKRRTETEKLIDWAFRTFVSVKPDWRKSVPPVVAVYEGVANTVAIAPAGDSYVTLGRGEENRVTLAYTPKAGQLVGPVAKGTEAGELAVLLDGKPEATLPVVTQAEVARAGIFKRLRDRIRMAL